MEDPPEDVFVSNVHTTQGNYRLFPGGWESAHSNLQQLLDSLALQSHPEFWITVIKPVESLLRLSDAIAERAGVVRWESPSSVYPSRRVGRLPDLRSLRARVSFGSEDLLDLGIRSAELDPFILAESNWSSLSHSWISESELTRCPLILVEGRVICVLPTAISVAARHYVLAQAAQCGRLKEVEAKLRAWQDALLFSEILPRMETVVRSVPNPKRVSMGGHRVTIAEVPLDEAAVALVGLLHDRVHDVLENGLDSMVQTSSALQQNFVNRIKRLTKKHELVFGCLVFGGLGRGWTVSVPAVPPKVSLSAIHLADLETFASVEGASLLRLMKLVQHEDWLQSQGVTIINLSGTLNLFAFWESLGHSLVPDDLYLPKANDPFLIPSDCLRDVRIRERINHDRHGVQAPGENSRFVAVERLAPHVFFPSQTRRQMYVVPEALNTGHLAGIVERRGLEIWVLTMAHGLPEMLRQQAFGIWDALLKWLDRAADSLISVLDGTPTATVQIHLEEPEQWGSQLLDGVTLEPEVPIVEAGPSEIAVRLRPGFLNLLYRTENDAERSLLVAVISGLITTVRAMPEVESREIARQIADDVIPGPNAREIHLYRLKGPTDHLPTPWGPIPRLIQPEDVSLARIGLAWRCLERKRGGQVVEGDSAQQLLHCCVDQLWLLIRDCLSKINMPSIIVLAAQNLESIYRDRQQWRLAARAVLALYGNQEETLHTAADRENERTLAAVSFRVLIEMAAATDSGEEGRSAGWRDIDRLGALVSTLLSLASHSDAIRGGLVASAVHVTESGRLDFDREYIGALLVPYSRHRLDRRYLTDASKYEEYRGIGTDGSESHRFSEEFDNAFICEYEVSIASLLTVVGALLDLASDEGKTVIRFAKSTLEQKVIEACGLARSDVRNGLRVLTLPSRDRWESAPKGYSDKDWYPWRFRRRLSVSLAPLVALGERPGDAIIFGANQLAMSVSYRLNGLEKGYFPPEHFNRNFTHPPDRVNHFHPTG